MPKNHPIARWRLRQEPPVTQDELGRMLGVGRSYICRLENGERRVALTMLDRVNRVTGLSPAVLRPDLARAMGHR